MVMNSHVEGLQEIEERPIRSGGIDGDYTCPSSQVRGGYSLPLSANDEALRLIHQVLLQRTDQHPCVVVFAGMDHGNGCSRICASVAELLARDPQRSVCVLEANLRSPSVSGLFGAAGGAGLTDALMQNDPIGSFCVPADLRGNLWLLSCGSLFPDAPALLTSGALRERMAELRQNFDFVIVDTPPLSRYADAIALGQLADGLILIVEEGSTRRDETAAAVATLRSSGVDVLAAVLNRASTKVPGMIYKML